MTVRDRCVLNADGGAIRRPRLQFCATLNAQADDVEASQDGRALGSVVQAERHARRVLEDRTSQHVFLFIVERAREPNTSTYQFRLFDTSDTGTFTSCTPVTGGGSLLRVKLMSERYNGQHRHRGLVAGVACERVERRVCAEQLRSVTNRA